MPLLIAFRIKEQQASRKRTSSDLMTEAIARIEQQQQEHGKMLEQLIAMRLSDKDCLCPPKGLSHTKKVVYTLRKIRKRVGYCVIKPPSCLCLY